MKKHSRPSPCVYLGWVRSGIKSNWFSCELSGELSFLKRMTHGAPFPSSFSPPKLQRAIPTSLQASLLETLGRPRWKVRAQQKAERGSVQREAGRWFMLWSSCAWKQPGVWGLLIFLSAKIQGSVEVIKNISRLQKRDVSDIWENLS